MAKFEQTCPNGKDEICACERCGKPGKECIDPFLKEVHDEEVERCLCDECYQNRVDDI
jgi:hypothetical protein